MPYRGSARHAGPVGGQVQLMFADGPSAVPQLKAGKVRALGVGNLRRSALLPDVPTIAESGLPDYEAYSWSGMMAPRGAGGHRRQGERGLVQVLSDPATASSMIAAGAEPPGTPRAFGDFVAAEIGKWREVIRKADIRVE